MDISLKSGVTGVVQPTNRNMGAQAAQRKNFYTVSPLGEFNSQAIKPNGLLKG
jgi:hypothetical protein